MNATVVATSDYEKAAAKVAECGRAVCARKQSRRGADDSPVIPGTGGVRKARWGTGTKGKSGGVRAIYYYFVAGATVYMLALYAKSQKSDLTEREKKELKKLVSELKGDLLQ